LQAGREDEAADELLVVEEFRMLLSSRCIVVGTLAVEDDDELAKEECEIFGSTGAESSRCCWNGRGRWLTLDRLLFGRLNLRSGSDDPEPNSTPEVVDTVVGMELRPVDDIVRLRAFELELALLRSGEKIELCLAVTDEDTCDDEDAAALELLVSMDSATSSRFHASISSGDICGRTGGGGLVREFTSRFVSLGRLDWFKLKLRPAVAAATKPVAPKSERAELLELTLSLVVAAAAEFLLLCVRASLRDSRSASRTICDSRTSSSG
jgi:hypothetical protein